MKWIWDKDTIIMVMWVAQLVLYCVGLSLLLTKLNSQIFGPVKKLNKSGPKGLFFSEPAKAKLLHDG